MKAMTCEKIKAWCLAALENRQSFFILFMESCAEKGQVSLLEENTDYFKIDVLVDVLNLMKNENLKGPKGFRAYGIYILDNIIVDKKKYSNIIYNKLLERYEKNQFN